MKRAFLLGALLLGLTACGGGGTVTPDTSYPYNPNANATQSNDARIPYRGDWVFVATLADGTKRYGVVGITTKYSNSELKVTNAGGGFVGWCVQSGCKQDDEQGTGLVGSVTAGGSTGLAVWMVPENAKTTRFVMVDDNGRVEQFENRPAISGQGVWTGASGSDQAAVFVFMQVRNQSQLASQQVKEQALLAAQRLLQSRPLSAQRAAPLQDVRAVLERSLTK